MDQTVKKPNTQQQDEEVQKIISGINELQPPSNLGLDSTSIDDLTQHIDRVDDDDIDEQMISEEELEGKGSEEESGGPEEKSGGSEEEGEESGEEAGFGQDYLLIDGRQVHVGDYFAAGWDELIWDLFWVPEMEKPDYIVTEPHEWQLKGALQAHMLCRSDFRGIICGDQMGLGKTLLAILAIDLARDQPGCFSLVVCPKACQRQWVEELENNYELHHQPNVLCLEDPLVTAHELLGGGWDVVVVSYEYLESNYRGVRDYPIELQGKTAPKRPTSALFSDLYRTLNLPIKRLVLDECQRIKNVKGARHKAVKALFYHSCILLSGTFLDNKWYDVGGLILLLRGHPFSSMKAFRKAFASYDYNGNPMEPEEVKIRLLQKFLMAITIARPSSLLNLKGRERYRCKFDLLPQDAAQVEEHTATYERVQQQRLREQSSKNIRNNEEDDDQNALAHAIRAQQYSLHRALVRERQDRSEDQWEDDDPNALFQAINDDDNGGERRDDWLERLNRGNLVFRSARVVAFLDLYQWLRQQFPDESIVVFSIYLRFLDIIHVALKKKYDIEALRYDGTVNKTDREIVRKQFDAAHPSIPLLLTGGAGGVGLNITKASIVVQLEPWWNHNFELQAYCRCYRQGQHKTVKIIRMEATNSPIDFTIKRTQQKKTVINERLMHALLRAHDEPPEIPKLPFTDFKLDPMIY